MALHRFRAEIEAENEAEFIQAQGSYDPISTTTDNTSTSEFEDTLSTLARQPTKVSREPSVNLSLDTPELTNSGSVTSEDTYSPANGDSDSTAVVAASQYSQQLQQDKESLQAEM